jgi:hypothetical protein
MLQRQTSCSTAEQPQPHPFTTTPKDRLEASATAGPPLLCKRHARSLCLLTYDCAGLNQISSNCPLFCKRHARSLCLLTYDCAGLNQISSNCHLPKALSSPAGPAGSTLSSMLAQANRCSPTGTSTINLIIQDGSIIHAHTHRSAAIQSTYIQAMYCTGYNAS